MNPPFILGRHPDILTPFHCLVLIKQPHFSSDFHIKIFV